MYKPNSLRQHLAAAIPELQRDPDRLLVFADEGNVVASLPPPSPSNTATSST